MGKIKSEKGFTLQDIIIALIVTMMFVSIIGTAFYNFYISTVARNRSAMATNCAIDIIESIEKMNYDKVNNDTVNLIVQGLISDKKIPTGYNVETNITKYNETEGNQNKEDIIKILKLNIGYTVGNKNEKFEITRLITK